MARIIGIDLGTTNSCVAALEGDEPIVLPNAEGSRTTPSIVAFPETGDRLVGHQAKRQAIINPDRTLAGVKRLMGRKYRSEEISDLRKTLPYKLVENVNADCWVSVAGQTYSPQEIAALVLRKMKATAEDYFGEVITEAVITVPAYFDDAQRQATKDAGKIAGLNVRRIVNEPTAAALAYGAQRRQNGLLAVVDLGGGTFDVSILQIAGGTFDVLSTCGDNSLGGDDFDRAIMRRLLEFFEDQSGVEISDDRMALQRLREAAEAAKCELSTLSETNINLPFLAVDAEGPRHLSYHLTRSELNEICNDLVDRLEAPCKRALADAGIDPEDLDEVLAVGGMTRMPAVRNRIEGLFGRKLNKSLNPDEVVAVGAAVQSGILGGELRELTLQDVTPLSLGIRVEGNRMAQIIPRNAKLPARHDKMFTTTEDHQDVVSIAVLQGESKVASENRLLGTFNFSGLTPRPKGAPRIEVTFAIDVDGIVHVSAKDLETGASQSVMITDHGGLTDDEIRRAAERAAGAEIAER
ncbi:MAG: molecular chaperone DnaK [Myxococcales bacterium]|nr:molecular chaperone DnaK [Myxococcales bacterium]